MYLDKIFEDWENFWVILKFIIYILMRDDDYFCFFVMGIFLVGDVDGSWELN